MSLVQLLKEEASRLARERKVVLEKAELVLETSRLTGLVRVLNVAYEKLVVIRYTLDDWETFSDLKADWVESVFENGWPETDKFCFSIALPYTSRSLRVQFAISYEVVRQTYWDNNETKNYELTKPGGGDLADIPGFNILNKGGDLADSPGLTILNTEDGDLADSPGLATRTLKGKVLVDSPGLVILNTEGKGLADSPGLAILVTCDYEGTDGISTMLGTKIDFKKMHETFQHLNYIVHTLQDKEATKANIKAKVDSVSKELAKYEGETKDKVIIFAFSGHGTNKDKHEHIIANDGEMLTLMHDIIPPLVKPRHVAEIPKLFFIDACRGSRHITDGRSDGKGPDRVQSHKGPGGDPPSTEKFFAEIVSQIEGNYRIDYCTIPDHVAYSFPDMGSIWMPKLAEEMVKEGYSFQNVAEDVRKKVFDEKLNGDYFYLREQCETDGILTNPGILYLTKSKKKPQYAPPASGERWNVVPDDDRDYRGLAILVTCDYKGSGIYELDDIKTDAKEMAKTFEEHLKYYTYQLRNPTKQKIEDCLGDVSKKLKESNVKEGKVIVFAFSGHGCSKDMFEHIMANDGEKLDIMDEVVLPLVKHEAVAKIPKLFLIDMCHRGNSIETMEKDCFEKHCNHTFGQTGKQATSSPTASATSCIGPKARGKKPWVEGNFRIDYSLIAGHNTTFGTGSIWMRKMCCKIQEMYPMEKKDMEKKDTYPDIAAEVAHIVSRKEASEGPKQLTRDIDRIDVGAAFYL